MKRREFLQTLGIGAAAALASCVRRAPVRLAPPATPSAPNMFVFVADDITWRHTSFAGCRFARTPHFDRVAREGAYFEQAFSSAPICTPTRGSLLTGLAPWQLGEGMQLLGTLPARLATYPNVLARAGYRTGVTGKGWGPGNWTVSGRTQDPAGTPIHGALRTTTPSTGMSPNDLPANFQRFMQERPAAQPFCFWFGCAEPHVPYEAGAGLRAGLQPAAVEVPPFLPDAPIVRSDLLDYAFEIEQLDRQLGQCLAILEDNGVLDDTLIIVLGDNGMPFAAAKHTCYEYGVHVPLALRWGNGIPAGQRIRGLVDTTDLTATMYAAAAVPPPHPLAGMNLLPGLRRADAQLGHEFVVLAHERGNLCRAGNVGYPIRAIRTARYLYIHNYAPERWPAGDPPTYGDVDPLPMKAWLIEHQHDPQVAPFFQHAMGKRPPRELFDIQADPGCLHNLAADTAYRSLVADLHATMEQRLRADGDVRVLGNGDAYEQMQAYLGKPKQPAAKPPGN